MRGRLISLGGTVFALLLFCMLSAPIEQEALAAGWRRTCSASERVKIEVLRDEVARKKAAFVTARSEADEVMMQKFFSFFEPWEEREALAKRYAELKARKDKTWLEYQAAQLALKRALQEQKEACRAKE